MDVSKDPPPRPVSRPRASRRVLRTLLSMMAKVLYLMLRRILHPRQPSPLLPQEPPLFAIPVPLLFGLALIVQLLSAGERDLDFCPTSFIEINF